MKIKNSFSVFLILLMFFACKNEEARPILEVAELLPFLNGTWYLESVSNGSPNPTSPSTPLLFEAVIWEINGNELTILLAVDDTFAKLEAGNHRIEIEETGQDDFKFLMVDGNGFGAITLTEGRLVLNTRIKPNEAISHAPIYTFAKKE